MFSSSARRVAFKASPTSITPSASNAPRVTASKPLSSCSHQRRLSSSKPSSPANGSKRVTEEQDIPSTSARTKSEGEKKASPRTGKRKEKDAGSGRVSKGKEGTSVGAGSVVKSTDPASTSISTAVKEKDEIMQSLPKISSANQAAPREIAASDFFALHRPISVATGFPPPVTDEAFAALFTPPPKPSKTSAIISNLTKSMQRMKLANANSGAVVNQFSSQSRLPVEAFQRAAPVHLDGHPRSRPVSLSPYQPFRPPVPAKLLNPPAIASELPEPLQQKTYTSVLTIQQSTHVNGDITYMAHSSPLVEKGEVQEQSSLEQHRRPLKIWMIRKLRRQRYHEAYLARRDQKIPGGMQALSVKRIRKLKMKKKKYKKLMKCTRTLRRKLDR